MIEACVPVLALFLTAMVLLVGCNNGKRRQQVGAAPPPNVLLISLDALRADGLGSYGCERNTSPFLDELASQGVRFTNAYANTHGTPPSHTTMLASLYQETHQVGRPVGRETPRNDALPTGITLVQELLRDDGYLTVAVTGDGYMSSVFGFDRGFDVFWDRGDGAGPGTDQLISLLHESWDGTRPVFAFFHTYEVHSPYQPPDEYREIFGAIPTQIEASNEFLLPIQDIAAEHLTSEDFDSLRLLYDAGIRYTDDTLARLFARLETMGFLDNALVIVTSDHGEEFGDHGGLLHRATLYEELLHVPLILSGAGIPEGKTNSRFVGLIDIVPTILAAAGLPVPDLMAGRDLLEMDDTPLEDEVVFAQYADLKYSIRIGDWKLIESPRSGSTELYNLAHDPHERRNLSSSHAVLVKTLTNRIHEWRISLPTLDHVTRNQPSLTQEQEQQLETLGYVD